MERDTDTDKLLVKYKQNNQYLREQLTKARKEADGCRVEAKQCRDGAELTSRALLDANRELDRMRSDNAQFLAFNGMQWLYEELRRERTKVAILKAKRMAWASLTRRATVAKATEAQRARDLDRVVEDMRQKLVECEQQRDAAVSRAEEVIADQKGRLDRIEEQCRLWKRGELDSMTAIAGITGEVQGSPLPEPGAWDRMRALQHAHTVSLMSEASDRLQAIESLLESEGVRLVNTQVKQVKDYIDLMKGRVAAAEESAAEKRQ